MPSPAYITTDDAGPKAVCPAKRRYELDTLSVITPQKAGLMNRILRRPPPSQDPYEIEEMKKAADAANGADATLKSFKSNPFAAHPDSDFKEMEGSLKSLDFMFNVFLDAVEALDLQTARATSSKVLTKTYQLQELAQVTSARLKARCEAARRFKHIGRRNCRSIVLASVAFEGMRNPTPRKLRDTSCRPTMARFEAWFSTLRSEPGTVGQSSLLGRVHWICGQEDHEERYTIVHHIGRSSSIVDDEKVLVAGIALHTRFSSESFEDSFVSTILCQIVHRLSALKSNIGRVSGIENKNTAYWFNLHQQTRTLFLVPFRDAIKHTTYPLPLIIFIDGLHDCQRGVLSAVCDFMETTLAADPAIPVYFVIGSTGKYERCLREFNKRAHVRKNLQQNLVEDDDEEPATPITISINDVTPGAPAAAQIDERQLNAVGQGLAVAQIISGSGGISELTVNVTAGNTHIVQTHNRFDEVYSHIDQNVKAQRYLRSGGEDNVGVELDDLNEQPES